MIKKTPKEEFIKGIKEMSPAMVATKSLSIAAYAHEGQVRTKGVEKGSAYINHPMRVAAHFQTDPILYSIAILHDVIEDTEVNYHDLLEMGIDPIVALMVLRLSRKSAQNYLEFILDIKQDNFARLVKIADIKDNMATLEEGTMKDKYRLTLYILETT